MAKLESNTAGIQSIVKAANLGIDYKKLAKQQSEGYILIVGPQGVGKTIGALRASKFFPHERLEMAHEELSLQKMVSLPDICHIAIDLGAQESAESIRVDVGSKNLWPIAAQFQKGFVEVVQYAEEIFESLIEPEHRYFILDTVSTLDDQFITFCRNNVKVTRGGKDNTSDMWTQLQIYHNQLRVAAAKVCVKHRLKMVVITHAKVDAPGVADKEVVEAKQEAFGKQSEVTVDLALTGKAALHYKTNASLILAAKKVVTGLGSRQTIERYFTSEEDGWELKSRMALAIGTKFPMHLGVVLDAWEKWKEVK